jgi:hypothetical protein
LPSLAKEKQFSEDSNSISNQPALQAPFRICCVPVRPIAVFSTASLHVAYSAMCD